MPAITQVPTRITITLEIERRGARDADLVTYLTREITRAMEKAQYATPAGSKLRSLAVSVATPDPTYDPS